MVKLQKSEKGFSIIEVLIVLAIAGLIMVVVFLAVPALQRNARNNALSTNANNIYAGASNYLSNNNGTLPTGPTTATAPAAGIVSITGAAGSNTETIEVDTSVATFQVGGTTITNTAAIGTMQLITGVNAKCNGTASGLTTGAGTNRSIALLYVAESASGRILRCLD